MPLVSVFYGDLDFLGGFRPIFWVLRPKKWMKVHFSVGNAPFSFVIVVLVSSWSKITIRCLNRKNREKNKGDRADYPFL